MARYRDRAFDAFSVSDQDTWPLDSVIQGVVAFFLRMWLHLPLSVELAALHRDFLQDMADIYGRLLAAPPPSSYFKLPSPFSFGDDPVPDRGVTDDEVSVVMDLPLPLGGAAAAIELGEGGHLQGVPSTYWPEEDRP